MSLENAKKTDSGTVRPAGATAPEAGNSKKDAASGGGKRRGSRQSVEAGLIDLELMTRIAAGEEAAVGELYDRFGSLVYRMAYQAMPTRAEADDAVQEVFVRLWKTAGRYDPKRAALVTWVMLISRRHLVDRMRRARARVKASSLDEQLASAGAATGRAGVAAGGATEPTESEAIERRERFASLMSRVNELPELQKTVVTRAYLGGQTLRQIGEELDTPIGTIKSALSRALVRLREWSQEGSTA